MPDYAEQATMGEDFATDRNLELPIGNYAADKTELFDVEAFKQLLKRKALLRQGQADMFDTAEGE